MMKARQWPTRCGSLTAVAILLVAACDRQAPPASQAEANAPPRSGRIVFGAVLPLTGDVASYGQKAKRGIELIIAETNVKGGVLGQPIVLDFQDDQGEAREAVSIVTKFATVNNYPVIFGSAGSTVTLAVAPIANRNNVVLISPISSSSKLSTDGGPFFFRTCPADDLQAEVLANWVRETGAKRVAIVYTNNAWGKPLADGFAQRFTRLGGSVLLSEGSAEGATDYRTVAAKVRALDELDAVISPTYPKEGGTFVRQARELGLNKPLFGCDNWGSPEFRSVAGDAADGVFYTAPTQLNTAEYEAFAKRYQARFHEPPDIFAAYAHDAADAVLRAVQACKAVEGEKIRDALHRTAFMGASGHIEFHENGDLKSEAFERYTIHKGSIKLVNKELGGDRHD